ncbi:hypothetical protein Tco_0768789 [Tanacetum coccineum]
MECMKVVLINSGSTVVENGDRGYFSRKEIEEKSPFRSDGIDLKKETYLRKSYCMFLQYLRIRLKVDWEMLVRGLSSYS